VKKTGYRLLATKKLSYLPGISKMGEAEFTWSKNPSSKSAMSFSTFFSDPTLGYVAKSNLKMETMRQSNKKVLYICTGQYVSNY
jgi:hypothetical protein